MRERIRKSMMVIDSKRASLMVLLFVFIAVIGLREIPFINMYIPARVEFAAVFFGVSIILGIYRKLAFWALFTLIAAFSHILGVLIISEIIALYLFFMLCYFVIEEYWNLLFHET